MVRSIRWRLQFWYAAMLAGVIGGFGGLVYWQSRSAQLKQVDTRLLAGAIYLDAMLRMFPPMDLESPRDEPFYRPPPDRGPGMDKGPGFDKGPGRGPDGPPQDRGPRGGPGGPRRSPVRLLEDLDLRKAANAELPDDGEPVQFAVWRADRSILKSSDAGLTGRWPAPSEAMIGAPQFVQQGDERAVLTLGPRRTTILVAKPIGRELAALNQLALRLAAAGAGALVVGLLGGWWMSSRVLRPIQSISKTAATISAAQLSERIDTSTIDRELAELATVLNATFARLEEEFNRQVRFTADASHELRTPLAVLHAQVELALSRTRSPEEYEEALERCRKATVRMRGLVDGLLMLARADGGKLDLERQPLDLGHLVAEVVEQHRPTAKKAEIDLTIDAPDRPAIVAGDAPFLGRVIENLVSNALRHTPTGGSVTVSVSAAEQTANLRVVDTGSGIPLADQPRIFERFFRADQARSRTSGGNGLGLAICKSIVEAHEGTIAFTSQPFVHTEFVVNLPTSDKQLAISHTKSDKQ